MNWHSEPDRIAQITKHLRGGAAEPRQGLNIPQLRRLVERIKKDALNADIYGFRTEVVLSIAALIEESVPALPLPTEPEPLSELRVVVDYNLAPDEVRVSPRAFYQLQKGLFEADSQRGIKR